MATYTVNMSNVQEVASQFGTVAQQTETTATDLNSQTQQLLSEWQSAARDAYNVVEARVIAAAQDMVTQVANMQAALSSINDNYANAEYQGLGLWNQ
jgi:WXG100 family type VII secretion target